MGYGLFFLALVFLLVVVLMLYGLIVIDYIYMICFECFLDDIELIAGDIKGLSPLQILFLNHSEFED